MAKRFVSSNDELFKFERERFLNDLYSDKADVDEWMGNLKQQWHKFIKDNATVNNGGWYDLVVFEFGTDEIDDEEYGLISFGDGIYKMVYMSARDNDMRFVLDD